MEVKKNPKADLERYKGLFFEIGIALSLAFVLLAFEWSQSEKSDASLGKLQDVIAEEEIIPITRQEEIKAPPPPPAPAVVEVLTIVENDAEIENEVELQSTEADQNTQIEVVEVQEEKEEEEQQVFFIVEEMPEFPGGDAELRKYIAVNIKYPEIAKENGIQGRVFVQFVVNAKGHVTDVKVVRGVDPALDAEAVRVVQTMPGWKPGKQRGKAVRVSYTVPINFTLQ